MKKSIIYLLYFTKRQLKQISFCLLLILLPCCTFAFSKINMNRDTSVSVALYSDSDALNFFFDKLSKRDGNLYFYVCKDKASLYQDVATGRAECGYLIPSTLYRSLDANQKNNLIQVIVSPSSTLTNIINEVVYSELFEEYSLHLLKNFILNESPLTVTEHAKSYDYYLAKASKLYHNHMTDGSTFHFIYQSTYEKTSNVTYILLAPIRGFISLFIFLSAFCGCIHFYNDKENHVYDNRTKNAIHGLQILSIAIPTILISMMGLFCLLFAGIMNTLWMEIGTLLLYDLLVILFVFLLSCIVRKKYLFISSIPVFLLGSILFTPIFIDISTFIPSIRPIQYLFLPFYYLTYWS